MASHYGLPALRRIKGSLIRVAIVYYPNRLIFESLILLRRKEDFIINNDIRT